MIESSFLLLYFIHSSSISIFLRCQPGDFFEEPCERVRRMVADFFAYFSDFIFVLPEQLLGFSDLPIFDILWRD